jgi:GNAT superfamily N-acetyltransferase
MPPDIRRLDGDETRRAVDELAAVLFDCVDGGASVGFVAPFTRADAAAYFTRVMPEVDAGVRILLAGYDGDGLAGTVQLLPAWQPNQPHRADVTKLLVHRRARGRGVGRRLMEQLESEARNAGRWLLVLDTVTGSAAYRLYERLGWTAVGAIPDYAQYPDGSPCETTFFYKNLT